MTCIVGIKEGGEIYIGGDSLGSNGDTKTHRKDKKVFKNGEFLFGFTSSYRMGQVLMFHSFKSRTENDKRENFEYLVTDFIDEVRKLFKEKGYLKKDKEEEEGGTFLIGYRGGLYKIEDDFQVGESDIEYTSVGCGNKFALGALFVTPNKSPEDRINLAIAAASEFSTGVGGIVHIIKQ